MFCRNCGNSIVPGSVFCGVCGTRVETEAFVAEAVPAVEQPVQQVVAAVEAPVQQVAAAVEAPIQQAVEAVEAAPEQAAAAVEAPVQQTVYQQPEQTVYQQPVQPVPQAVYQQPEQPVQQYQQPVQQYQQPAQQYQQPAQQYQQPAQQYQQPVQQYQQSVYAQPVYPQPETPVKKKKSRAPAIIITIVLILVLLAGAGVAYLSFISKAGNKTFFGIDLNFADFTKLSDKQEEEFLDLVEHVNNGIVNGSVRSLRKGINKDALAYVCKSFNCSDENDFIDYFGADLDSCGVGITASAKAYLRYEIKDCKALAADLEKQCGVSFDISEAYLVECVSTYKGSDGSKTLSDNYVFMKSGDTWSLVLMQKDHLKDLGLDD